MSVNPNKNTKRTRRADGVLSPEELDQAIKAYKARRAERMAAKADEGEPEGMEPVKGAVPPTTDADEDVVPADPTKADEDETVIAPADKEDGNDTEEKLQMVKDRRDRRDQEGDPKDKDAAMGVIAQQDGDMDILFDIIDTLLAARDFDGSCAKDSAGCVKDGTDEEVPPAITPAKADEDDESVPMDENTDSDDDEVPSTNASEVGKSVLNVDSIDAIVRQRVQLGIVGRALNMDGLENMNLMAAKKAVIRTVRPSLRLDGKSTAYINAAFDCACADVQARTRKDTSYQKHQMFNKDTRADSKNYADSSADARQRMIDRQIKKM